MKQNSNTQMMTGTAMGGARFGIGRPGLGQRANSRRFKPQTMATQAPVRKALCGITDVAYFGLAVTVAWSAVAIFH